MQDQWYLSVVKSDSIVNNINNNTHFTYSLCELSIQFLPSVQSGFVVCMEPGVSLYYPNSCPSCVSSRRQICSNFWWHPKWKHARCWAMVHQWIYSVDFLESYFRLVLKCSYEFLKLNLRRLLIIGSYKTASRISLICHFIEPVIRLHETNY